MDPRTLQEAASRLAKFTSDEVSEPPHHQWSDIYKVCDEQMCKTDRFLRDIMLGHQARTSC